MAKIRSISGEVSAAKTTFMKPVIVKPRIYRSGGRWRFVPAVNTPGARQRNIAALRFMSVLNRRGS